MLLNNIPQPDDRRDRRQVPGSVQAACRAAETAPPGQEGNMMTHFSEAGPAMKPGDETVGTENLGTENPAIEDWVYDCRTCRYTEQRIHRAGSLNTLQLALYR